MLKYNNRNLLDIERKKLKMKKIAMDKRKSNNIMEEPEEPLNEFL